VGILRELLPGPLQSRLGELHASSARHALFWMKGGIAVSMQANTAEISFFILVFHFFCFSVFLCLFLFFFFLFFFLFFSQL